MAYTLAQYKKIKYYIVLILKLINKNKFNKNKLEIKIYVRTFK